MREADRRAGRLVRQHALWRGVHAGVPAGGLHLEQLLAHRAAPDHPQLRQEGQVAAAARLPQRGAGGGKGANGDPAPLELPRRRGRVHLFRRAGRGPHAGPRHAGAIRAHGAPGDESGPLRYVAGEEEAAARAVGRPADTARGAGSPPAARDAVDLQHRGQRVPAHLPGRARALLGGGLDLRHRGAHLRRDPAVGGLHGAQPDEDRLRLRAPGEVPQGHLPRHREAHREAARSHD
mmetsp:Transcript_65301/g.202226  ORF Transcript_65301/g.202226 Transcript_65301/m.202226 type:complete len:235 (+) Transcript_65301:284-988(+)